MKFIKMHGLGNDYVFVDCLARQISDPERLAMRISDRHTGVGGDGLILICPSSTADARMEMYNADGSRAQTCGNGIRCVAKYLIEHGHIDIPCERAADSACLTIETDAGIKTLRAALRAGRMVAASVDMGVPSTRAGDLPARTDKPELVNEPVPLGNVDLRMTCVSVGNPHAILFVKDIKQVDLSDVGPRLERHPMFPERINVHLVQVQSRSELAMRSWERGSGLTHACGTGATAALVAAVITAQTDPRVTVHLPGGDLSIEWADDHHLWMTGPAEEVFSGDWPDE
jgi:diaminopimelate epimerase